MDTPEPTIVFNDDARKLPDGTINLTGLWTAVQTVSLAASLQNSHIVPDDLKAALKAHIEKRLDMEDRTFAYLAPITVAQLPNAAMADRFGAAAFIVRTTIHGVREGEYLALDAFSDEVYKDRDTIDLRGGNFEKVKVDSEACWRCVYSPNTVPVADTNADTNHPADTNISEMEASAAPASPTNAIQVVIEFDPATQGFTCGVVQNGVPIGNWNPFAVLQMLTQFTNQLVGDCGFQHEQMIQTVKTLQENAKEGALQSRLVVASANTPLPPMPRMQQRPKRN